MTCGITSKYFWGGGRSVKSFDCGKVRMKYKHLEKFLNVCGGPFYISEVNITPRKRGGVLCLVGKCRVMPPSKDISET
jgi:hypothetical protein